MNTDNKLDQDDWSCFVAKMNQIIRRVDSEVHFFGGPSTLKPWQNACWVFETKISKISRFKKQVVELRYEYEQNSVAVLSGDTEFI